MTPVICHRPDSFVSALSAGFWAIYFVAAVSTRVVHGTEDDDFLEKYNITIEEYEFWKNATNFNGTFPSNLNGSLADSDNQYGYGYGYAGYGYPGYPGYGYPGYPGYPSYNYPSYPGYTGYPGGSTVPQQQPQPQPQPQPQFPPGPGPTYAQQPPAFGFDPDSQPANINDGIANRECYYIDTKGKDYRGFHRKTASGKNCLNWASTPRNANSNPTSGLEENFCRNPSDSARPWCYKSGWNTDWWGKKTSRHWEHCDVPACEDILVSAKSQFTRRACIGLDVKGDIYTAYQDEPMRLPKTNCICKWGSWYCGSQQTEKPCTGIDNDKNLYVVHNQRGMKIGNTDCMCKNGIWFCDPVSAYNND